MKQLIRHILREHVNLILEMPKKINQDEWIKRARKVHGYKYDYSKVNYVAALEPVTIICPTHGEFEQKPHNHVNQKQGCPKCAGKGKTTEEFIKRAKQVHGDKYDYSKVKYISSTKPVKIICPIHGEFEQTPSRHYVSGCNKCGYESMVNKLSKTTEKFIKDARKVHGDKYDYSLVDYKTARTPIKIICPKHGEFIQDPNNHLQGVNCPKCEGRNRTTDEFINDAKEIHGDRYDYSLVDYRGATTKIEIICPKHGVFTQTPHNHLKGYGCQYCSESQGEKLISDIFEKYSLNFDRQKRFLDCRDTQREKRCLPLPFDFYLPTYNVCVEYDGIQHFESIDFFGGEDSFNNQVKLDKIKNQYCKKNGIKLIRIPYTMKKEEIEPYILKELGIK